MKHNFLLLGVCFLCVFSACKPKFDLNAEYRDITVVYGILNFQDSINYVKIYKGFQSDGNVFVDALNPNKIYYDINEIDVKLIEYYDNVPTSRAPISLYATHDFPREAGIFYFDKEKIIYRTYPNEPPLQQECSYKIKITNNLSGKVVEGITPMVGEFTTRKSGEFEIVGENGNINFGKAENAKGYEIRMNFYYIEVDNITREVVYEGKISKVLNPQIDYQIPYIENMKYYSLKFPLSIYNDLALNLKPNSQVTRYAGTKKDRGCIEFEGWAAEKSLVEFLLSSKPITSFIQVNTYYTNISASDGLAFGFISSRFKTTPKPFLPITIKSEDSLVKGSITRHLSFRPRIEFPD